jgi:hypothetical protein
MRAYVFLFPALLVCTSASALQTPDRAIKSNMQVDYLRETASAETWSEWFARGALYGRARLHVFAWDWNTAKETGTGQTRDNAMIGAGGRLIYKTARWQGWSATVGGYSTVPLLKDNMDTQVPLTNFGRAGKDTYRTRLDGSEGAINVLAEAYAEFRAAGWSLRAGRQIVDTVLLASNDTKMVPQTFEAVRADLRTLPRSKVTGAVVLRQKLRNHATFHSVLAYAKSTGNDDSGAHCGLSVKNLARSGKDTEPALLLLAAETRPVKNVRLALEYVGVPGELALTVGDASADFKAAFGWTLTPGVRWLRQFDRGAGAVGGAAISGVFALDKTFTAGAADLRKLASYDDPRSADGGLGAARLGLARGPWCFSVGLANIADEADIIAPWRGFPTGGFTRLMGQVDWLAGTRNRMARVDYDFGKTRLTSALKAVGACGWIDCDDRKVAEGTVSLTDRRILTFDVVATFRGLPQTEFKVRTAFVRADAKPSATDWKNYESYRELRVEMNHLF